MIREGRKDGTSMVAKKYLIISLFGMLFAGIAVYAAVPDSREKSYYEVGRFQLFQGNYISIDLKRQQTSSHTGVFLVDTKTGAVKRYLNKIDENGRYIETWLATEIHSEK
jgi:hypothetical protein